MVHVYLSVLFLRAWTLRLVHALHPMQMNRAAIVQAKFARVGQARVGL